MRIVFLGSGAFAIPAFLALRDAGHELVALVTQPDRESGRGRALAAPPLKPVAEAHQVPVLQPARVRDAATQEALRGLRPQLQVVVAFGQILPRSVIEIAPLGTVNLHASLLPRYRGAAPIQWAIAKGETETGVTTMLIDEGLDTGPLLLSRALTIGGDETAAELAPRLAELGAAVLLETVAGLAAGTLVARAQDHGSATLAPLLRKQDGLIDWSLSAAELACRVRGFAPWPGVFTHHAGRLLKVRRARAQAAGGADREPGSVVAISNEDVAVACHGGGLLQLLEVQPESRAAMSAPAWAHGLHLTAGERLG